MEHKSYAKNRGTERKSTRNLTEVYLRPLSVLLARVPSATTRRKRLAGLQHESEALQSIAFPRRVKRLRNRYRFAVCAQRTALEKETQRSTDSSF